MILGDPSDSKPYTYWLEHDDPSTFANTVICLIHQANYLLDRQIAGLERQFVREGGYSEKLAAARSQELRKNDPRLVNRRTPPRPVRPAARR